MGSYDSMEARLRATGLYSPGGGTVVDAELRAYAAGLDPLLEELKTLRRESFAATAEDYGLSLRESACGFLYPPETAAERRERLNALGAVTQNDCRKADLEALAAALGFTAAAEEDAANGALVWHVAATPYHDQDAARKQLEIFTPAHLNAVYDFLT